MDRSRHGRILTALLLLLLLLGVASVATRPVSAQVDEPLPLPEPVPTLPPVVEPPEPTTTLPPTTTSAPTTTVPPSTTTTTTTTMPVRPRTTLPPETTTSTARTAPSSSTTLPPAPTRPPPTVPTSPPPTTPVRWSPRPVVLPEVVFPEKSPDVVLPTSAVAGGPGDAGLAPKAAVKTIAAASGAAPNDSALAVTADGAPGATAPELQALGRFTPGPVRSAIRAASGEEAAPAQPPLLVRAGSRPLLSPLGAVLLAALAGFLTVGTYAAWVLRTTRRRG